MQSKVKLSSYCWSVTIILTSVFLAVAVCGIVLKEMYLFYTFFGILLMVFIPSLIYAPHKIEVADNQIVVKSYLKYHRIPMRNAVGVDTFLPTMGAIRIIGSGGFLGYWGIFREGDVGRYVAYYGKSSDCFMVRMKNGDKYVLGCENSHAMVDYISSLLK